ncbi:toxin-antitoxin system HicB family antitoxin [Nocardia sp. BMG111209]|uniref:toxin-antitoxin system HicB family antitoxin n=1 Tax=Nocardia sp. BMG111209 TaxID=1160137 RepID=UPI00035EB294|nr:toxin-antitoxin system HicB family antitoxin [Nocardia sp. BMG111209]
MDLEKYTTRLREDLIVAAALGDEKAQATAAALAAATENSARLTLLSALSDLAAEISAELDGRTVHITLDGTEARVNIRRDRAEETHQTFEEMTGDISRVTLRLVENLKSRAEEAASQSGQSLNSWVSSAVQGALREQRRWQGYGGWRPAEEE